MKTFRKSITSATKFGLYKLNHLPLAFFAGVKVKELTDRHCKVVINHNYFTKNPFKSMYFAAQAMAAEMSTGALVLERVIHAKPIKISMLVLNMQAAFSKKATGKIFSLVPILKCLTKLSRKRSKVLKDKQLH